MLWVKLYTSAECKSIIIAVLAVMSVLSVVLPGIVLIFPKTVLSRKWEMVCDLFEITAM